MTMIKVHEGLTEARPGVDYHLGHYEIDFQDGPLRFQLQANLCEVANCPCDRLRLTWIAENRRTTAWYTPAGEWLDNSGDPINQELAQVFGIAEKTETFQERVDHLWYLRRKAVLAERGRSTPPEGLLIPKEFLFPGADGQQAPFGKLRLPIKGKDRSIPFFLGFCKRKNCFCQDVIVEIMVDEEKPLVVSWDQEGAWHVIEGQPGDQKWFARIKSRLETVNRFKGLLMHMRQERLFQNYYRFVQGYEAKNNLASQSVEDPATVNSL